MCYSIVEINSGRTGQASCGSDMVSSSFEGGWQDFPMEDIRIVLGNQSVLMRDMLRRTIGGIQGLRIVGETDQMKEIEGVVEKRDADWAIVSLPAGNVIPDVLDDLLARQEDLSLLAISNSGKMVKVRKMALQDDSYQEMSLDDFTQLLLHKLKLHH